ncbi:MAG: sigma-70 family RNA polymerase sigma factor [Planctomycetaceae bacterium]
MDAAHLVYREVSRRSGRDDLILEHLPLVRHIVGRLAATLPEHVDRANLESAGVCGLVESAANFDPERGVAFSCYAYPRIRGAILDELRRNCPLPQHVLERLALLRAVSARCVHPPTTDELAHTAGLSSREVEDCLRAAQLVRQDPWPEDLADQLPAPQVPTPQQQLERSELLSLLTTAIEELPEQMRIVITLYYRNGLRLREIAEVIGLSESRVSRILSSAEARLRQQLVSEEET